MTDLPAGFEPFKVRGELASSFIAEPATVKLKTYEEGLELFCKLADWLLLFPHETPPSYAERGHDGIWIHDGNYDDPKIYKLERKPGFTYGK